MIPGEQRECIKNSKELVLLSTGKFMEIWDRDTYAELNKATTGYAEKVDERLGRISNAAES